jgi:hypothetical protein
MTFHSLNDPAPRPACFDGPFDGPKLAKALVDLAEDLRRYRARQAQEQETVEAPETAGIR